MRSLFASLNVEAKLALGIFLVCGPICHILLAFWAGSGSLYFAAIVFQPQVFIWIPVCAPFIALLGWPVLTRVWAELKHNKRRRTTFILLNAIPFGIMLVLDLWSPNVMPYEIKRGVLGDAIHDFENFKLAGPPAPEEDEESERPRGTTTSFGETIVKYQWKPSAWSPFRAVYYCVLLIGWALMFLQATTSFYAVVLCIRADSESSRKAMERNCTQLLGAMLPVFPFVVLRRINHFNKAELYGVDAMNLGDFLLGILILASVVGLLFAAHSFTEKLKTAFSTIGSLGAIYLFVNPTPAANVLFGGGVYQTVWVILGIPTVLALLLVPWMDDSESE